MNWLVIGAVLVVGYLAFKWLVKPLFKIALVLALAAVVWLLLTNSL